MIASCIPCSPTPDGDADAPVRETRTRSRRVQFAPENEHADEDFKRELQRELEEPLQSVPSAAQGPTSEDEPHSLENPERWNIRSPTPEERLDWYMDAALKEVKGARALQLAREDKLRQADLWNLQTFGQHM
ncbi:hypothetical protein INS49_003170 [Diaporthe citri]|uniref:uncharacterized protein n=1 Tax=Diaporthe citri TaxID=83186 RepID=UPI001C8171BD|nr:uncharacterized protein INS49_003170 [Diaporthe citri]KAG6368951.1 hypothetical protein INS49_003170 [Diaporthe citri]